MKNILVPTDFSECANKAAEFAIDIAKKNNAEIHFLHLFNARVNWKELRPEQEHLYPEVKKDFHNANTKLDELVKKATEAGLNAKRFMEFNQGRSAIDTHINDQHHDFVIMGSQGASKSSVLGSNAQKVIRNSNAPALVLKSENNLSALNELVFCTDMNSQTSDKLIMLKSIADMLNIPLKMLTINTPSNFKESAELEQKIEQFMKPINFDIGFHHIDALNVERGISHYCAERPGTMIAIGTHGKGFVMNLISPSVAENVVNHITNPALIFRL